MDNDTLIELSKEYGTPFYVFDMAELERRVEFLRSCLPPKASLCYAMKANPFVLPKLAHMVDRLEVCSEGEYRICQNVGIDPEKLVISGVNKNEDVLREAIMLKGGAGRYTVESPNQFNMLRRVAQDCKVRLQVLLRLTSGNQFGMDASTIKDLAARHRCDPHLDICGLQFYSGTQKGSLKRIGRELSALSGLVDELQRDCGVTVREIEYGPGLPVDYFDDRPRRQIETDERAFLHELARLIDGAIPEHSVTLEIGRSLVASCGTYVTRIVDAKTNDGENFAIVDGGMHHLVYYGNSLALKQPPCRIIQASAEGISDGENNQACGDSQARDSQLWNICGSLCTASDTLAKRMELPDVEEGRLLAFDQVGAYCMTEGISLFLSRDLPAIVTVDETGHSHVVRKRLKTSPINTPQPTIE